MIVVYRVMDATNDPDRVVQGRVVVKVLDRPEPPQNVKATAMGSQTAFVQFDEPASNGGTISGYTVTDLLDGRTYNTTKPGMQIKGLTNGAKHRFTVVATNEAGDSDPSAPSAEVKVDVEPDQMAAPTVVGSDGTLDVTWAEPHNEGSKIQTYTVFLYPESGGQPIPYTAAGTERKMTISGLKNGALYSVRIQAQNDADKPSLLSEATGAHPHGAPDQPTDVRAVAVTADKDPNLATVEVSWTPDHSGGTGFGPTHVMVGDKPVTAPAGARSVQVPLVPTGRDRQVSVELTNTDGDTSAKGYTTVSIATTPAPIADPTLSGTGKAGQLKVTGLSVVTGRGFEASDLTLRYSADPNSCASGERVDDGDILPANGWESKTYYFCQTGIGVNNQPAASPVASATGTATGRPSDVGVRITNVNSTSLTVRWDPIGANPALSGLKVYLNNREQPVGVGATEATFSDLAQGTEYSATVAATNEWGTTQMQADSSVVTKLDVNLTWTEACQGGERYASPGGCHTFTFSAPGWAGTSLTHKCTITSDLDGWTEEVTIDRAGPIESNIATRADSEAAFAQKVRVGNCRPVR